MYQGIISPKDQGSYAPEVTYSVIDCPGIPGEAPVVPHPDIIGSSVIDPLKDLVYEIMDINTGFPIISPEENQPQYV